MPRIFLLAGLLAGASLAFTSQQLRAGDKDILSNGYIHVRSHCGTQVWRLERAEHGALAGDYAFKNEHNSVAYFREISPSKLKAVAGNGWDLNITVTVIISHTDGTLTLWFSTANGWHDSWVGRL